MGRTALGSDGAARHPGAMAPIAVSLAAPLRTIRLRWADRCSSCAQRLPAGAEVHWNRRDRLVVCRSCTPARTASAEDALDLERSSDLRIDLPVREPTDPGADADDDIQFHWVAPRVVVDEQALGSRLGQITYADVAAVHPPMHLAS